MWDSNFDNRKSKFVGGVRKPDKTIVVSSAATAANPAGRRPSTMPPPAPAVVQPAVRGVLNSAIARSKEIRRQARKAALQDAVDNIKSKTRQAEQTSNQLHMTEMSSNMPRTRTPSGEEENEEKSAGVFMATFRNAVQRAYDSVGDPEKEGVNQDEITDILSKLGYSSEDRETQNILSAAANLNAETGDDNRMKFQDIFKLVVGRNEEETLADITNAFEIFDRDDDGRLQTKDLHRALTRIGDDPLTEEEFQEILLLAELDPDLEAFFDYKDLTNHKLALGYASTTTKSTKKAKCSFGGPGRSLWNRVPPDISQKLCRK